MKIVFICSTNASVIKHTIQSGLLNGLDIELVSDRLCGAIDFAKAQGISYRVLEASGGNEFSILLSDVYSDSRDTLFISFYTRLLTNHFLSAHEWRVINFHPSILPACPGMNGFGDTIKSGAMFIGSTVHFIDSGVDTGSPIIQASYPRSPELNIKILRHRVFLQQTISLIQVILWFVNDRFQIINGKFKVVKAQYEISEFSPNLDDNLQDIYNCWLSDFL